MVRLLKAGCLGMEVVLETVPATVLARLPALDRPGAGGFAAAGFAAMEGTKESERLREVRGGGMGAMPLPLPKPMSGAKESERAKSVRGG
jgi:hypothetical protein